MTHTGGLESNGTVDAMRSGGARAASWTAHSVTRNTFMRPVCVLAEGASRARVRTAGTLVLVQTATIRVGLKAGTAGTGERGITV